MPDRRSNIQRMRDKYAAGVVDVEHGTLTAYTYGCRCDDCRSARRGYDQARRSRANPRLRGAVYR